MMDWLSLLAISCARSFLLMLPASPAQFTKKLYLNYSARLCISILSICVMRVDISNAYLLYAPIYLKTGSSDF